MFRLLRSQGILLSAILFIPALSYGQSIQPSSYPTVNYSQADPVAPTPPVTADEDPLVQPGSEEDILSLDLGQLGSVDVSAPSLNLEVTSVSRSQSTVGKSPAAIFVVTNEMIRRSAARTVPEVLRMVPGVNVQRISGTRWAISIRGLTGRFANKLLVQIDGRNVYTPLFAGTFWDEQDVLLEDVDRIEVIRGPGAAVWGANAVNGVINVITKSAKDTKGVYVNVGAGDEWQSFSSARVGGQAGENLNYRVYGKWQERDSGISPVGPAKDDSRMQRVGGRLDWEPTCADTFTLQGDYYVGNSGGQAFTPSPAFPFISLIDQSEDLDGGNVLSRWVHKVDSDSQWALQMYFDRATRTAPFVPTAASRDVIDVDFQYETSVGCSHAIVWGLGYRHYQDNFQNGPATQFVPNVKTLNRFSYFAQDKMTLIDDKWYFILGAKFGHNDYTDFEMQPTGRLLWTPTDTTTLWGSVSYAVRTPSRLEREAQFVLPPATPGVPFFLQGNTNNTLQSEDLVAYEFGMRSQPSESFFWDVALFLNDYRNIATFAQTGPLGAAPAPLPGASLPFQFFNDPSHQETWGGELATTVKPTEAWEFRLAHSYFRGRGTLGSVDSSPRNLFYFNSSHDIGCNVELNVIGRYQDVLPVAPAVSSYYEMDVQLGWSPFEDLECTLVGRNLLDRAHLETPADIAGGIVNETLREFYGGVTYRY